MPGACERGVFPLFMLPGAGPALVVGEGRVAARKAAQLRRCGFAVDEIAPVGFADVALERYALAVAATGDRGFNRRMAAACRDRRVPVNAVDDPRLCTFYFGAMARKSPFTVAVSTGGCCPEAGRLLRDRIAPLLTDGLARAAGRMGAERERWKADWPDPAARAAAMRRELQPW